uniref:Uncharacterized protein n=1 Tax=Arundo donax TaxID=35708 RepID=A0A0A8ZZ46_ARUDO
MAGVAGDRVRGVGGVLVRAPQQHRQHRALQAPPPLGACLPDLHPLQMLHILIPLRTKEKKRKEGSLIKETWMDKDPREAILKYTDAAEKDPKLIALAYSETQPNPVFAESSCSPGVESMNSLQQKHYRDRKRYLNMTQIKKHHIYRETVSIK